MIISHKYEFIFIKTSKVAGTSIEMFLASVCGPEDICTPFWHPEKNHESRNEKGRFAPWSELWYRERLRRRYGRSGVAQTLQHLVHGTRFFEPMPAWQVRARISPSIWNSYYKFTVERNPWDKVISRYFHSKSVYEDKYNKPLSYENFWVHFLKQLKTPWETPAWGSPAPYNLPRYQDPVNGDLLVNRILRYEDLNNELSSVCSQLGIPFEGVLTTRAKSHYRREKAPHTEFFSPSQMHQISKVFAGEINLMGYAPDDGFR